MKCWCVSDWEGVFVRADLRKCRTWSWIGLPLMLNSPAYSRVISKDQGPALCWAYVAVLMVASNMPNRGVLADERGPLDLCDLAALTRLPEKLMETFIKVATDPKVAWLEERDWHGIISGESSDLSGKNGKASGQTPDLSGSLPAKSEHFPKPSGRCPEDFQTCRDKTPSLRDYSTEQRKEEVEEEKRALPEGASQGPRRDLLERLWRLFSPRRQLAIMTPAAILMPWVSIVRSDPAIDESVERVEAYYAKKNAPRPKGVLPIYRTRLSTLLDNWNEDLAQMEREEAEATRPRQDENESPSDFCPPSADDALAQNDAWARGGRCTARAR